ncbi:MAG: antitoxin Xre/MbcA/ParS toxin-binding domain-containing protein [Cyanobacteria bacterium J06631_2]
MTQAISKSSLTSYEKVRQTSENYGLDRLLVRKILGISESTQFRYEKKNPVLNSNLSDRWSRFERILQQAEELFEDKDAAQEWLSTPKVMLTGKTPLESLVDDAGATQVREMLTRAAYGIFG